MAHADSRGEVFANRRGYMGRAVIAVGASFLALAGGACGGRANFSQGVVCLSPEARVRSERFKPSRDDGDFDPQRWEDLAWLIEHRDVVVGMTDGAIREVLGEGDLQEEGPNQSIGRRFWTTPGEAFEAEIENGRVSSLDFTHEEGWMESGPSIDEHHHLVRVVRVVDGSTIDVTGLGIADSPADAVTRLRLGHIAVPTAPMPEADSARRSLISHVPEGSSLVISNEGVGERWDADGALLVEAHRYVTRGGIAYALPWSEQCFMVAAGWAVYVSTSYGCDVYDAAVMVLSEDRARRERTGAWATADRWMAEQERP